jgi:hypothetical protein
MNEFDTPHPSHENLTGFAMGEPAAPTIADHIRSCEACTEFVKEIRLVSDSIAALPEEAVPDHLRDSVLSLRHGRHSRNADRSPYEWIKSRFLLYVGLAAAMVFLYFVITRLM